MKSTKQLSQLLVASAFLLLTACAGGFSDIQLGDFSGKAAQGSAAGSNSRNNSRHLRSCPSPLGTLALYEKQTESWWEYYYSHYPHLGSTIPLIRLMVQQSNCFVVVERGRTLQNIRGERELSQEGELREGSNFKKGQLVAADYTLTPSVLFSEKTGSGTAILGAILSRNNPTLGQIASNIKQHEASTSLLLIDNRSGVQIAAANGSAKKRDFGIASEIFGSRVGGGISAYERTPEGKIITAAFADAYNQMVISLQHYKAQSVKGGLGKGGRLRVGE